MRLLRGRPGKRGHHDWSRRISLPPARAEFEAEVDRVADAVGAVPAAHGFSRVTLPGEPELAVSRARAATGLPFAEETWRSIVGAARTLGVEPDEAALVMSGERGG